MWDVHRVEADGGRLEKSLDWALQCISECNTKMKPLLRDNNTRDPVRAPTFVKLISVLFRYLT